MAAIETAWDKNDFRAVADHCHNRVGEVKKLETLCRSYLAVSSRGRFRDAAVELLRWTDQVARDSEYRVTLVSGDFDHNVAAFFSRGRAYRSRSRSTACGMDRVHCAAALQSAVGIRVSPAGKVEARRERAHSREGQLLLGAAGLRNRVRSERSGGDADAVRRSAVGAAQDSVSERFRDAGAAEH